MFIIYGTRSKEKTLGELAVTKQCEHCGNVERFKVIRIRKWFTIFWIPIFPIGTKYYVTCPICRFGEKLKKAEAMDRLEQYGNKLE